MEGDSVPLESGVTQIQKNDLIRWWFGPLKTRIAEIDKAAGIFSTYVVPDGRFRGRLQLDNQTGSLTIMNTSTTDSGEYNVTISRSTGGITTIRFNVTVYEVHAPCCDSVEAVLRLVVTALMGVASLVAVVLLVNDVRASRGKTEKTEEIS
ncbi:hypothetical protein R3I93_016873 [Phoxinus phoxinus]|uniref:Immunoglobulin V-set domain-containing protein n=1 Tax=Phoxinus phoxinus TaxID=58324 RepID=A0AAN9CI99_9TELE